MSLNSWMLNMMLGPANQALSQNMQLIRNYNQYGISALQPQQQNAVPNVISNFSPNPNAMPANQALHLQSMMQQTSQLMAIMLQMSSILSKLKNANINLKDYGLTDEQLAFLDKTLPVFQGSQDNSQSDSGNGNASDSDGSQSGRYKAIGFLAQLLKKNDYETGAEDGDDDGAVASEGDLAVLKAAMDDELFDKTDLTKAFQYLLVKGDAGKLDELLALFSLAEKEGLVTVRDFLKVKFVSSLSEERQALIAGVIAQRGLSNEDGRLNTRLVSFLISSMADEADTKFQQFGRTVLGALADTWLQPGVDPANANRQQLIHLLNLAGFVLTPEGTPDPDAEQPFPLGSAA